MSTPWARGASPPSTTSRGAAPAARPPGRRLGASRRLPHPDETQYKGWIERLNGLRIPSSGAVDRYYFRSLYFREPNGILFEIATDGPGFDVDEPLATIGEKLALPPFLEPQRAAIERGLKPLS